VRASANLPAFHSMLLDFAMAFLSPAMRRRGSAINGGRNHLPDRKRLVIRGHCDRFCRMSGSPTMSRTDAKYDPQGQATFRPDRTRGVGEEMVREERYHEIRRMADRRRPSGW
jgi:hypothetical protein